MKINMRSVLKAEWFTGLAGFLGWSMIFGIIYAQSPLYTSNQNTYFLHGLASAGLGNLKTDWLANTADPTPVFSGLVFLTYALTHSGALFYVYYALLMGIYLYSMTGIAELLFGLGQSKTKKLIFFTLLLGLHSAALRFILSRVMNAEATFMLEGGLGNQRILGQVFQPSAFGVFLVLSIYIFLLKKDWRAIPPLAAAVYFHPTYLLGAALITTGYLWMLWREKKSLRPILIFALETLGAVLPVVIYTYLVFGASDPATLRQAEQILINVRVPHHALVVQWFNWTSIVQLALIAGGLLVTRKTPLFPLFAIVGAGALTISALQVLTGSSTLALLFPWRISVVLVPLGTVCIAAYLADLFFSKISLPEKLALPGAWLLIGLLMAAGVIRFQVELSQQRSQPAAAMMAYAASHRASGEIYITPSKMQEFRLVTGSAVFIDFKSNPYRDTDVLEWNRRIELVNTFYDTPGVPTCRELTELLNSARANRIVLPVEKASIVCDNLSALYQDASYTLLALK